MREVKMVHINGINCQLVGGMHFAPEAKKEVIEWLLTSYEREQRIRFFYGENGKPWNEECDTIGHVGRTTGSMKVPILIKNSKSTGGGEIIVSLIIRIDTKGSNGKIATVYDDGTPADEFYHVPNLIGGFDVLNKRGGHYGTCETEIKAKHLAGFMNGTRWSK